MNISHIFFKQIWKQFEGEIIERIPEFTEKHRQIVTTPDSELSSIRRHHTGEIAGSVDLADGIYLYLLVRAFKPTIIFEIGTWTGMSAMFMAEALQKNGSGHIYTCDVHDHYVLPEAYEPYITRIHAMSDQALIQLPSAMKIDFVFTDGDITTATLEKLHNRKHERTIIATHDFAFPGEKGVSNLVYIQRAYKHCFEYIFPWHPENLQITLRSCTALLVPPAILNQLHIPAAFALRKHMYTFIFFLYMKFGAAYRKLHRLLQRFI